MLIKDSILDSAMTRNLNFQRYLEGIKLSQTNIIYIGFLFCVFVIYLIAAIYSVGFHQADEHYQIIDFARFKLGEISVDDLAWEYKDKMRSGVLPGFCYLIFYICSIFRIENPFVLTLILRVLTIIFSFIAILRFSSIQQREISKDFKTIFIGISFLLWFFPYINCRFSSETFSGLCFVLALTYIHPSTKSVKSLNLLLGGLLLGLSILLRYQLSVMVIGFLMWFLIIKKVSYADFGKLCLGATFSFLIGLVIDKWLYGEWVFPVYNYIYFNIFKNISSFFGVSPWYEYVRLIAVKPFYIFGAIILATYLTGNAKVGEINGLGFIMTIKNQYNTTVVPVLLGSNCFTVPFAPNQVAASEVVIAAYNDALAQVIQEVKYYMVASDPVSIRARFLYWFQLEMSVRASSSISTGPCMGSYPDGSIPSTNAQFGC